MPQQRGFYQVLHWVLQCWSEADKVCKLHLEELCSPGASVSTWFEKLVSGREDLGTSLAQRTVVSLGRRQQCFIPNSVYNTLSYWWNYRRESTGMIIPVRCFTCGKVIGNKWDTYLDLLQAGYSEG